MIEHAIVETHAGRDVLEPGAYVRQTPYPCYMDDKCVQIFLSISPRKLFPASLFPSLYHRFLFMIEHVMPLCLTISWVYSVAMLVQSIVYEKEQRLKEVRSPHAYLYSEGDDNLDLFIFRWWEWWVWAMPCIGWHGSSLRLFRCPSQWEYWPLCSSTATSSCTAMLPSFSWPWKSSLLPLSRFRKLAYAISHPSHPTLWILMVIFPFLYVFKQIFSQRLLLKGESCSCMRWYRVLPELRAVHVCCHPRRGSWR